VQSHAATGPQVAMQDNLMIQSFDNDDAGVSYSEGGSKHADLASTNSKVQEQDH